MLGSVLSAVGSFLHAAPLGPLSSQLLCWANCLRGFAGISGHGGSFYGFIFGVGVPGSLGDPGEISAYMIDLVRERNFERLFR